MTETQPQPVAPEQLEPREQAFRLTQEVFRDPARVEAIKAGIARYTTNVDGEFKRVDAVLQAQQSSEVFQDAAGGAPWMLWGAISYQLESGQTVRIDDLQGERLQEMIYQAYVNSAASGV